MKPFHFLLAPDSFKGALTATQVCVALERGIRRAFSAAAPRADASTRALEITAVPLADGGEGTVEAFARGAGGTLHETPVQSPLGETVVAKWLVLPDGRAVLEMAQSSGLNLVPEKRRDALHASSFGLGETMRAALDCGCRELLIGVGGSATSDGGAGALHALGARFLNARGEELPPGGGALSQLARVDLANFDARLRDTKIQVLCDVTNPLLGENGAARIFAPQKGATPRDVETLENALSHFADIAAEMFWAASTRNENMKRDETVSPKNPRASTRTTSPIDLRDIPGAGAAGGTAFGLMRFCGATLTPGIDAVLEATHFSEKLGGADLVFTGEGSIDSQTPHGKTLSGVARAAQTANVPVVAFGGRVQLFGEELRKMGIAAAFPISDGPISLDESIARAAPLLENAAERAAALWLVGREN